MLRGANVGGNRVFRPAQFVKHLAALDVVNIGAAGTFVVRSNAPERTVRARFARALPFTADLLVCTGEEVLDLVASAPFGHAPRPPEVTWYVTVLGSPLPKRPTLPISAPDANAWQVRVIGVTGRFVCSLARRGPGRLIYPNEVVDTRKDVPATTRNWNTILKVASALGER
jgi:uncharacterized protein (DUF1697 family)